MKNKCNCISVLTSSPPPFPWVYYSLVSFCLINSVTAGEDFDSECQFLLRISCAVLPLWSAFRKKKGRILTIWTKLQIKVWIFIKKSKSCISPLDNDYSNSKCCHKTPIYLLTAIQNRIVLHQIDQGGGSLWSHFWIRCCLHI